MKILVRIEKRLILVIIHKSKYYDGSNILVGKMKDETGGVGIEEFVGSKPKMYSFLIVVSIKKQCI